MSRPRYIVVTIGPCLWPILDTHTLVGSGTDAHYAAVQIKFFTRLAAESHCRQLNRDAAEAEERTLLEGLRASISANDHRKESGS
jgi:hypothetical protein